jgi:membrane protein required for colicin V production
MLVLDFIILLFLVIGALRGYFTGFIIQSITLVALVVGIWAGVKYNGLFSGYLIQFLGLQKAIAPYISFAAVFICIIVLAHLTGMLITKFIDKSALGIMNRIAGIIFGVVKTLLIISVTLFFLQKFDPKGMLISEKVKDESKLYRPVEKIAPALFPTINFEKIKKGILGI